ncbi:MAG: PDZ domain-containing protein [Clostridiales bacterium]|nr:PDZ domain-containing protein [Clostridiales bacterium]
MSKKISLGLALALIIASITATFAITMSVSQHIYNGLISDLGNRIEMYSTLEDVNALIRSNYYYYSSVKPNDININVAEGFINGLGDKNNRFLTAEEYQVYKKRLSGNAVGIGITTSWDDYNGALTVTSVAEGSSASAKGMKVGDVITSIDGEKVTASTYESLLKTLEGDNLTTVDVSCSRNGKPVNFKVTIGYSYVSVSYKVVGGCGYIKISAFYSNTKQQLLEAITELQNEGATKIIFDLRGTSDGSIEYAAASVDSITPLCDEPDEVIVSLIDNKGETAYTYSSTSSNLNIPMVVLVNKKTSGVAELFACDLRDFEKAELVGENTAGNGMSQEALTLEDGSAVILTTTLVKPYKSSGYNGIGLKPDYEVKLPPAAAENVELLDINADTQLQKAIEVVSKDDKNN